MKATSIVERISDVFTGEDYLTFTRVCNSDYPHGLHLCQDVDPENISAGGIVSHWFNVEAPLNPPGSILLVLIASENCSNLKRGSVLHVLFDDGIHISMKFESPLLWKYLRKNKVILEPQQLACFLGHNLVRCRVISERDPGVNFRFARDSFHDPGAGSHTRYMDPENAQLFFRWMFWKVWDESKKINI